MVSVLMVALASPEAGMWWDYGRTLVVMIGICLIAGFGVKVVLPKLVGVSRITNAGLIHIFARQPLEPGKTLYLVRTGRSVVLLAAAGDRVQLMTTLNADDYPAANTSSATGEGSVFQRIIRGMADREGGGTR